jgi:hypothetical protein
MFIVKRMRLRRKCAKGGGEFNRSMQHRTPSIGWGFEAQGLSRAPIEPQGDCAHGGVGKAREIGSSREVLP